MTENNTTPTDELNGSPSSDGENNEKTPVGRVILDIIETIIISALLFVAINYISARIRVDGSSMVPTFTSGEFIIVNKLAYKFSEPRFGDIVVFDFPRDPNQEYIKRVIGLPGDTIRVEGAEVYVNEFLITEPYIAASPAYQGQWDVPANHLFVLGDNRNNSSDSHTWGPVPYDNVIGKAVFIYWPFDAFGIINSPTVAIAAP